MHLANIKTVSRDAGLTPKVPPFLIKVIRALYSDIHPQLGYLCPKGTELRFSAEHIPGRGGEKSRTQSSHLLQTEEHVML